ncbi:Outer membrane protein TolC [Zobellia uliginosa]|uniref:Outer membrane protein TolC n=1 Tax=Zobellia uliginosa TaxID=143224 RepID=A0ABY1KX15_9FLAO|nr:TolC family protein [Zobellia uliginosa]SIS71266.1 Outer membrane protein TolC [Zobellia uliginosa]
MKQFLIFLAILMAIPTVAQQRISLTECYQLVNDHYPLAKQKDLLEAQSTLESEAVSTSQLPQVAFDAYATYLSDVIEFPLAMSGIEPLNNDQYRATVSVNQLIYNGGATGASLDLKSAQLKAKQKEVEVSLYQLKKQINQVYFSVLLAQESEALLSAKEKQLRAKLKEVQSGIKYGVLLPASDKVLEAELLKIGQQFQEIESDKKALVETLSSLIGKPLTAETVFERPFVQTDLQTDVNRPELEWFELKKEEIEGSEHVLSKQNAPKLLGFATGGYGNPGLNMLDNSFQGFYTVGVKLNWKVFDWNANKKQREALAINKDIITKESEAFRLNTNIELNRQQREIEKIEGFIASDQEIIRLRKEVLQSADSQLKNGVITASAYITELTNLYEDENTLIRHKIQLELAKANYNVIKG